jgi:hypothetical protein
MSKRGTEWWVFSEIVSSHIENYTVPQYGDAPNDPVEVWTPAQCMDSVKRYANRIDTNSRGRLETLRDMAKVAHFACMAFGKLKPTTEEIAKIVKGTI